MMRKVVDRDERGGLVERWVDMGPSRALVGRGAPTTMIAVGVGGQANAVITDGRKQTPRRAV